MKQRSPAVVLGAAIAYLLIGSHGVGSGAAAKAGAPSTKGAKASEPKKEALEPKKKASADPTKSPGKTTGDLIEKDRYVRDLELISKPRPPGSKHWKAVQDLAASTLKNLGYEVDLHRYDSGTNVVGLKKGRKKPAEQILLSAHYDSVPDCPGADDNGTGVAGLLEAARILSKAPADRSLVVAFWDEEERGLLGSAAYADRAMERGEKIVFMCCFEMIGFKSDKPGSQKIPPGLDLLYPEAVRKLKAREDRGDFIALILDESPASKAASASFVEAAGSIGLETLALPVSIDQRALVGSLDLFRSDHASFWRTSVPAMMITDTANFRNANYHCEGGSTDELGDLDHDFAIRIVRATVKLAEKMLEAD